MIANMPFSEIMNLAKRFFDTTDDTICLSDGNVITREDFLDELNAMKENNSEKQDDKNCSCLRV